MARVRPGRLAQEPNIAAEVSSTACVITGLLTYFRTSLQARIDSLFAHPGVSPLPPETAQRTGALRIRRKRIASVCMFVVLTVAMPGGQVRAPIAVGLTIALNAAIAVFTWQAHRSVPPYGVA
ncbi:MAG: hypothetical protein V2G42_07240 [bacterium JZ-2024 1]